jgi:fatty acid amide hydrolase 2
VLESLQARGMVAEARRFGALKKQFDIWSATIGEEREVPFGRILGDGKRTYPGLEMLKWAVGASNHTWMSIVTALVDPVPDLLPGMRKKLLAMRDELRAQMLDAMGDDGVMLYPTYVTTAPKHYLPAWQAQRLHMPFAYQGVINALDFPATQVPLGLDRHGLPLGVQVISKPGNDHVTIAVAEELERAFGGWVPPFQRNTNRH